MVLTVLNSVSNFKIKSSFQFCVYVTVSWRHSTILSVVSLYKSTFAANYKYLSYKYKICPDEWFMDKKLLIGKMKVQFEKGTQSRSNAHTIVELCDKRDGIANCDIMTCTEASKLIDLITLE